MTNPDPIDELRELLHTLSEAELIAELEKLRPARAAELERRLKPFRTPVTEATMRRGCWCR